MNKKVITRFIPFGRENCLLGLMVLINVLGTLQAQSPQPSPDPLETRVEADLAALETQIKLYKAMNGSIPTTEQGLVALVMRPRTMPSPSHWMQLVNKVPLDPWGTPYKYRTPGVHNPNTYDLYSAGPDKKPDTADDIGNW